MADQRKRFRLTPLDLIAVDELKARDLLVKCFFHAQSETFSRAKQALGHSTSHKELEKTVVGVVKTAFKEAGFDYEKPSKKALVAVVDILAENAIVMGTPKDIVLHHEKEIQKVLDLLV